MNPSTYIRSSQRKLGTSWIPNQVWDERVCDCGGAVGVNREALIDLMKSFSPSLIQSRRAKHD